MARIRSCHPEQWSDDQFVTCSPLARLLALGIRNWADDNGIFEWNPIKLKMRVLPADSCDVAALLGELEATNQVHRFEADGRQYGLVRSFDRFQRPKKPSYVHPVPKALPVGYALRDRAPKFGTGGEPVENRTGKVAADVGVGVVVGVEKEEKKPAVAVPARAPRASGGSFKAFLASCKAAGDQPIAAEDPIWDYAESVGIPPDLLELAWKEFSSRHRESRKRQLDWRAVFRNAVRDNWYRLWAVTAEGSCVVTSQGRQARLAHAPLAVAA